LFNERNAANGYDLKDEIEIERTNWKYAMVETGLAMEYSEVVNLGNGLAAATANWLAEKAETGFKESLMSEALLIIPLVEYFTVNERAKGWSLTGEWHEWGEGVQNPSDVNIDLVAERDEDKVLVEFKYLKTSNDRRLIKDLVKLAFRKNADYKRLLLVAYSPSYYGKRGSNLVREITRAGRPIAFHLTKRDLLPEVESDLKIPHSLGGEEAKAVARIMTYDPSVANFGVELVGSAQKAGENVSVLSVSRV
jgi:hypothetical protein